MLHHHETVPLSIMNSTKSTAGLLLHRLLLPHTAVTMLNMLHHQCPFQRTRPLRVLCTSNNNITNNIVTNSVNTNEVPTSLQFHLDGHLAVDMQDQVPRFRHIRICIQATIAIAHLLIAAAVSCRLASTILTHTLHRSTHLTLIMRQAITWRFQILEENVLVHTIRTIVRFPCHQVGTPQSALAIAVPLDHPYRSTSRLHRRILLVVLRVHHIAKALALRFQFGWTRITPMRRRTTIIA
mmetsp:Transcript_23224/g.38469  ORF Transcript_23224/g.38469 Transcript_23224/m.38469 type:complete len:239 (+) Transcript_23224:915-1631(+)